jgi:hypothetical protein
VKRRETGVKRRVNIRDDCRGGDEEKGKKEKRDGANGNTSLHRGDEVMGRNITGTKGRKKNQTGYMQVEDWIGMMRSL